MTETPEDVQRGGQTMQTEGQTMQTEGQTSTEEDIQTDTPTNRQIYQQKCRHTYKARWPYYRLEPSACNLESRAGTSFGRQGAFAH